MWFAFFWVAYGMCFVDLGVLVYCCFAWVCANIRVPYLFACIVFDLCFVFVFTCCLWVFVCWARWILVMDVFCCSSNLICLCTCVYPPDCACVGVCRVFGILVFLCYFWLGWVGVF